MLGKNRFYEKAVPTAEAASGVLKVPTGAVSDRYVYYPGTEELGMDEIRIIATGTGMPASRKGRAAASFLVET